MCRWQSCALFSFWRTEAEAPTKAMRLRGVIRSIRTDLNSSTLRRRGEGETANRVKIRPSIGLEGAKRTFDENVDLLSADLRHRAWREDRAEC